MFELYTKHVLSAAQSLEYIQALLKNGHETKDAALRLAFCNNADTLLLHMKKYVKRTNTSNNDDGDQFLRQGIAAAYLDHANMMADLGHPEQAQNSRRRAEKWGGPGVKDTIAVPVKKAAQVIDVATVNSSIFPASVSPLTSTWTFPEPDGRVADTPQLVSCLGLLKQLPDDLSEDALDPSARNWLKIASLNPDEKPRLETLALDLIRFFIRDEIKDKKAVAEVLCLAPVLGEEDTRVLLRQFQDHMEDSRILDISALRGLARLMQTATPEYLHAQDLIDVLLPMSKRLQETHAQSPDHILELTIAVSSVLDAMADIKVTGLDREGLHAPLLAYLADLQKTDDPHLRYYAAYAFQALLCVPDDESLWQATVRRTTKVVKGISGLVSAVKGLDLNGFIDGLYSIQEGFEGFQQVISLAKTAYEGVSAVYEGEQDLMVSLKEGLTFNRKRAWYSALRGADTLIDGGDLMNFKVLVCTAPCRRELAFQWGICQRLGGIAANKLWDDKTRRGAVRFLGEIYCNDLAWGQLPPIKLYILNILSQLSAPGINLYHATRLLEDLKYDHDAVKQDIYRSFMTKGSSLDLRFLQSGPPELAYPSLLDRVQQKTDVEADLRRISKKRMKEQEGTVYVPPLAKTHLRDSDKALFPLAPMVNEFLHSDQKVLLLLGDSGAGKTTFNRELDRLLWSEYKPRTERIPLLINLPAIDRPEKDLIPKHLRINEFLEPQIRELKAREFVIICDGYDESQQSQNLYEMNGFNKEGGWKVQMVISCRSEHLNTEYRDLFQPFRSNNTDPELFRQAILVPFSPSQIKDYIASYVFIKRPMWGPSDYEHVLEQIPSLQDLVKNPFLLSLALEVLPRIADPNQKLTANKITRVLLYDEFVTQWLERNKKRFAAQGLSDAERKALDNLSEDGFTQRGLTFLKGVSAAIYNEQDGNPVVEYSRTRDVGTWKEEFFDRKDEETQMIRKAVPMTRSGTRFGFIHRSILEYGVSLAIYEPQHHTGLQLETVDTADKQPQRRKSTDSAYSFDYELQQAAEKVAEQKATGITLDSPFARRRFIKDASVIQFLVERVQSESVFEDQLFEAIQKSKGDRTWRIAAANAMTVLVRARTNFSNRDLEGIQVPRADMSYGIFDSAQLQKADLRKTNLQGVWFRQADLSNARMDGAQFGELPTLSDFKMTRAFEFTSDGERFIAGTKDGKIVVYSALTWDIIQSWDTHNEKVFDLIISEESSLIVSMDNGVGEEPMKVAKVKVWDLQSGLFLHSFGDPTNTFTDVKLLPGCRIMTCSNSSGTVDIWDGRSGRHMHCHMLLEDDPKFLMIDCSPDGNILASLHNDQTCRLWDIETFKCSHIFACPHPGGWNGIISFSPDGKFLQHMTGTLLKIWEVATGSEHFVFDQINASACGVFSPDSRQLAVCGIEENTVSILNPVTGESLLTLRGHTDKISMIVYSSDGMRIATSSEDRTIRLWDARTSTPGPVFEGHVTFASRAMFSPSGKHIASVGWDGCIHLWDSQVTKTLNMPPRQTHRYNSGSMISILDDKTTAHYNGVTFSPCGHQLAVTVYRKLDVLLCDVITGENIVKLEVKSEDEMSYAPAYSPDGIRVATTSGNETKVWNRQTGLLEYRLTGHEDMVNLVLFSPNDGQQLVSFGYDSTIRLWDISTGSCIRMLEGPEAKVAIAKYSTDGSQLLAAYENICIVQVWGTATGERLQEIDTGCQYPLLFTPGGRLLVTVFNEDLEDEKTKGNLQVWDVVKEECIWTLAEPVGLPVTGISSDGHWLASCCADGVVRLWDLRNGQQIAQIENYGGEKCSLALDISTMTEGDGGGHGLSLAVGSEFGDVSYWKLVEIEPLDLDTPHSDRAIPSHHDVYHENKHENKHENNSDKVGEQVCKKTYKFLMQWTTAYGKLNAEGAIIEGTKGLGRSNLRLLKQHGACGEATAPLNFHQAVTQVMSSKNVLSKFGARRATENVSQDKEGQGGEKKLSQDTNIKVNMLKTAPVGERE
ncbi:hypothetical protein BGX21_010253 [Mortierella sp. AD011]|nr:hypothetical protein BGX20_007048 [Mortierella sp. AD010]KAF9402390.1 hypothetical protein BGX21_010253 [Mortierella sp. AD011]